MTVRKQGRQSHSQPSLAFEPSRVRCLTQRVSRFLVCHTLNLNARRFLFSVLQPRKHQMSKIANQQTHDDSSRRDAERADHRSEPKTQPYNVTSARDHRKDMPLEPISLLVAAKVPASIAHEASYSDEEERRRVHPGEETFTGGALHKSVDQHHVRSSISTGHAGFEYTTNNLIQSTKFSTSGIITSSHLVRCAF